MKKIILTLVFTLVLFSNVFSQESENKTINTQEQPTRVVNQQVDAQKNVTDLKTVIKMSSEIENKVLHLFLGKYKMIMGFGYLPKEHKQSLEENLKSILGEANFKKAKSNTALFENLLN